LIPQVWLAAVPEVVDTGGVTGQGGFAMIADLDWNFPRSVDRCHQQSLLAPLHSGVRALRAPVDSLLTNWAYLVLTTPADGTASGGSANSTLITATLQAGRRNSLNRKDPPRAPAADTSLA
jgi:hypothetical protein